MPQIHPVKWNQYKLWWGGKTIYKSWLHICKNKDSNFKETDFCLSCIKSSQFILEITAGSMGWEAGRDGKSHDVDKRYNNTLGEI